MNLYTKYESSLLDKKMFLNYILKTFISYVTSQNDFNNLGNHLRIIYVEFGQIPITGLGEEVVRSFPYKIQCKIVTPRAGSILRRGHNLNNNQCTVVKGSTQTTKYII